MSDTEETTIDTVSSDTMTINLRLGKCEVCSNVEAKYTCPKCEVKTCRLQCLNIHKKELKCDGIRDRTKFVRLKDMSKMDYMSDYYFLEECTRFVETRKCDKIKHITRYSKTLPTMVSRLRKAAEVRKVDLKILLENFTKRKENSSVYDYKNDVILWHIEWVFTNAGNLKAIDERCNEKCQLAELLDKYLNPEAKEEVSIKSHLEFYQSQGIGNLNIFLKAEGVTKSRTRFYPLDCAKTLKENLSGKTLVEFPCIYVSYGDAQGYDIIDSDDDIDRETKEHCIKLERLQQETQSKPAVEEKDEIKELQKVLEERKREDRHAKRQKFENEPNNYLFADDNLLDVLSSSDSENE